MINNNEMSFCVDDFVESLLNLQQFASTKKSRILLKEALASGKFIRADLGVFRKSDDHSVWRLEKDQDGKDYIVRTEDFDVSADAEWSASSNRRGDAVTLAYRNYPIRCFSKVEFKFEDSNDFAKFLVAKAKQNTKIFAKNLVKTLPFEERLAAQKKFKLFREG